VGYFGKLEGHVTTYKEREKKISKRIDLEKSGFYLKITLHPLPLIAQSHPEFQKYNSIHWKY
jgi:hypothetical protein